MMVFLLIFVFIFGAIVGSFLNLCIYRIPLEKSLLWPGSRCGQCLQPVRWYDNVPLLSYLLLRGHCRKCHAPFSSRYFFIELLTGLCFAGLFYLEIVCNIFNVRWGVTTALDVQMQRMDYHLFPTWQALVFFIYHALLVSFLIVVTFCDFDHREIPLPVTVTGTIFGLVGATILPWPWPRAASLVVLPDKPLWMTNLAPPMGLYPWPLWWPLPAWLPPGSWQLGLATGLVGLLVGTLMLRAVRFLFSTGLGVEALGLGDADLMMMAGSFLGWQPVIVAFFISVLPGLLFAVVHFSLRRRMAGSPDTIAVRVDMKDHVPVIEMAGQSLSLVEFGAACANQVTEGGMTRMLLDTADLEATLAQAIAEIEDAARRAGARRIRAAAHDDMPGLPRRLARFVLSFIRVQDRPTTTVQVFPKDGAAGFKVNDQEVPADQLTDVLKDALRNVPNAELRIDSHRLEKWADQIAGNVRMTAQQAGIQRIHRRDNAIPFGPALAVGILLTILAWPWLVSQGNLVVLLFNGTLLFWLAAACAGVMLGSSYAIRVVRLLRG
jgi:leader peptidase (prepilin peptidase)/N-methyltransferase